MKKDIIAINIKFCEVKRIMPASTTLCINKFWTMSLLNNSTNIGKSFYLRDFNFITALTKRIGSINANYK